VRALRWLSALKPSFAVLGNHDGGIWAKEHRGFKDHAAVEKMLDAAGIELLHNRAETVTVAGGMVTLVGVGDLWAGELDAEKAFQEVKRRGPVVLLAHNPDSKELVAGYDWDLMLSGHTHGGQVLVPFQGPRFAPVRDKRFVAGLGEWNGRRIYVSRGVGSLGGVRLGCRPEVSVLDLVSAG
jgi:predicted MPP superfamily phosphohydrolase